MKNIIKKKFVTNNQFIARKANNMKKFKNVALMFVLLLTIFSTVASAHAQTNEVQEKWINSAVGRYMNPDGMYGAQCKDLIDDYANHIFDVSWVESVRPGNAKYVFNNANPKYWHKIKNRWGDLNNFPRRGDVIVWGDSYGKWTQYGHTAVVLWADAYNIKVIDQNYNGRANRPAEIHTWKYITRNCGAVVGWLRPKAEMMKGNNMNNSNKKRNKTKDVNRAGVVRANIGLNLRTGPSLRHRIILAMPNYSRITVVTNNKRGAYYLVQYRGRWGWAHKDYIELR